VPKEDEEQEFAIEKRRQTHRSAIGVLECEIGYEFASGHEGMIVA
jgi:hypothetical protein